MLRALGLRLYRFWWGTGLADDVPALTYYLVLSLAPFALGLAALEALALKDYVSALEVAETINRYLPAEIHGDVQRLVTGTRSQSPLLLLLAFAAMLWTSSGAIGVVERCISRILDVPRHNIVFGRLRNMALGFLVAVMVIVAAASATIITGLTDIVGISELPGGLLLALNWVGSTFVLALVYKLAPLARLHWRTALFGAAPAGLGLQLVPAFVGVYVQATAGFAAVRLFLLIAIVLLGLYTMATVILVGAGIAARRELRLTRRLAGHAAQPVAEAAGEEVAEDSEPKSGKPASVVDASA